MWIKLQLLSQVLLPTLIWSGSGKILDPKKHFIVCANIIGSCYGSTCPRSISSITQKAYGINFPLITIRDITKAHNLLRQHLAIKEISLCIGGSCGGHQVMEFAYLIPQKIKKIALLVTSARETAWAIASHAAQRLAIKADSTWQNNDNLAGQNGLKAARGMALLGYRTFNSYIDAQTDDSEKLENFKAVILSGSPNSVRGETVLHPDLSEIRGKKPLLAVCYGAQYLAHFSGGKVAPSNTREYGRANLSFIKEEETFFQNISLWMPILPLKSKFRAHFQQMAA